MKSKKRWSLLLMCICISFSLAGCTGNPSEGETLDVEAGDTFVQELDVPANNTEDEDETMSEDSSDISENMPWVCGGVVWTGSWFTIWVSEEAADRDMPIVAQIDEEYSEELQALSGDMEIEVRLAGE